MDDEADASTGSVNDFFLDSGYFDTGPSSHLDDNLPATPDLTIHSVDNERQSSIDLLIPATSLGNGASEADVGRDAMTFGNKNAETEDEFAELDAWLESGAVEIV